MDSIFGNVVIAVFIAIMLVIWIGILVRLLRGKLSKTTEVLAVVANKQCYEKTVYLKSQGHLTKKEYVVTFLCGKRKLYFRVSEFSYGGYKINQKGTLKYKGSKLIDFK